MASTVSYDNSGAIATGGTATVNVVCSFTVAAGATLLAAINITTNVSISACAANGTQMTQISRVLHTSAGYTSTLYGLTAGPSGTVSISANVVGGGAAQMYIAAASYLGVRAALPWGKVFTQTGSVVATLVMGMSTSTTDMVVAFLTGANAFTATSATTRKTNGAHVESRWVDAAGTGPTASISASCVTAAQNLWWIGVNLAGSADASLISSRIMMVRCGG